MNSRRPEVADVLRIFGAAYREAHAPSPAQDRVLRLLPLCRTASLGGHRLRCDTCGHEEISYNSCRNRHCPKCRAAARAEWLVARERELLDVPYFHVVFTLPEELAAIALQNKAICYDQLFRASAETLRTIAADARHLGAEIGFLAVLHTWNQKLLHHPHVHCVVPGGGFSAGRERWIACRRDFFLPVRVLSRLFRRLYLQGLEAAQAASELEFHGQLEHLRDAAAWKKTVHEARAKEWVVYAKPPFGGPTQVLKYLARYTHRVAISNARIESVDDRQVRFLWKDRSNDSRCRSMTLAGVEFVRRFLLHVLPKGFVSIRHFGFLANRTRRQAIPLAKRHLQQDPASEVTALLSTPPQLSDPAPARSRCPRCREGQLVVVQELPQLELPRLGLPVFLDTS
jgi:hypothetical protein